MSTVPKVSSACSLLQRRKTFIAQPSVDCALAKSADNAVVVRSGKRDATPSTATPTTPWSSKSSKWPQTKKECQETTSRSSRSARSVTSTAKAPAMSLLERRRRAFTADLTLDGQRAHKEGAAVSPFARPSCKSISERLTLHEVLGQGSAGVVYRGRSHADGEEVAVKVMRIHDEELVHTARKEYDILKDIQHPHIIRAIDFFTYPQGVVLVEEFFSGRNLEDSVTAHGRMAEATAQQLFAQLMGAVAHLHSVHIIHRDVKAQNVLVSSDRTELKLVDFNTAKKTIEGGALTMTGTFDYMPPEVLLGDSPSASCDVWASGLCLHFMLSGLLPLERKLYNSHAAFGRAVSSRARQLLEGRAVEVSELCKQTLQSCLEVDPDCRASAQAVLESGWFREPCE